MDNRFSRSALLLGEEAMEKISKSRVAVFGVGGVGGYVAEGLVRSGIGALDLIDNDTVSLSNINRQIIALESTIGKYKTEVVEKRAKDINPEIKIVCHNKFVLPENINEFDFGNYDYVVDAIDTVSGKIALAVKAYEENIPIISSMGAGNKLDATLFEVSDVFKTSVCPLARVMRTELKKRNVKKLKVVYSKEQPIKPAETSEQSKKRQTPGSVAFVPSVVGMIVAGEVIKDLIKI